jgi:hypothetical protein
MNSETYKAKEIPADKMLVRNDGQIIVIGTPDENGEHNCDFMGCGSCEHVIMRVNSAYVVKGWRKERYERIRS